MNEYDILMLSKSNDVYMKNIQEVKKEFYSIQEFAKKLGFHPNTIRKHVKCGRISSVSIGNKIRPIYRIPVTEIERMSAFHLENIIDKLIQKRMQE